MKAQVAAIRINGETQKFKVETPMDYEELYKLVKEEYPTAPVVVKLILEK